MRARQRRTTSGASGKEPNCGTCGILRSVLTRIVQGVPVPAFIYGTAWKEAQTEGLVRRALEAGFRGIDTANQRRHYVEVAVGDALAEATRESQLARADLFLQTKFTDAAGQDRRIPYDPALDPASQVRQSFESSLEHLRTEYVDSYVLHGPSARRGLTHTDWSVWRAMEDLQRAQKTRLIGVSNVSLDQLVALERDAAIKPAFVQNRCYASTGWDREVRAFCNKSGIVYQGFSLLTANARALEAPAVKRIAQRTGRSPAQVVLRFALQVGMLPLTGTSSSKHMKEDLACFEFELDDAEVLAVERVAHG
jgi:diketogulonate reductase-like aldo/keto reductase